MSHQALCSVMWSNTQRIHGCLSTPGVSTRVMLSSNGSGHEAASNLLMNPLPKMERPCVRCRAAHQLLQAMYELICQATGAVEHLQRARACESCSVL